MWSSFGRGFTADIYPIIFDCSVKLSSDGQEVKKELLKNIRKQNQNLFLKHNSDIQHYL